MMAKHSKLSSRADPDIVEVKSKFAAEFRRFSLNRQTCTKCDDFHELVETLHGLQNIPFVTCYTDPKDGDLLPINNDDNFHVALNSGKSVLRLIIQKRGDVHEVNGYGGTMTRKRNPITKLIQGEPRPRPNIAISLPEDFRRVSAIIDVDVVPETHRRVKLMKNGSDKPLGFYIRDGTSVRMTPQGLEKVPGIFISRLVPGGLAESTGLLAVNDEVLEVNGIEVSGKTLDQVTDMMVANSANLIITVKPVNQRNNIGPRLGSGRQSEKSTESFHSAKSFGSDEVPEVEEEEDEVRDFLGEEDKDEPEEGATGQDLETVHLEVEEQTYTDAKEEEETPEKDSKSDKDKDSAVVTL